MVQWTRSEQSPAPKAKPAVSRPVYFTGLDLGQLSDPTALAVLERTTKDEDKKRVRHYAVRHLQRWQLKSSYPAIVDDVVKLFDRPPLQNSLLVIDATGVGRAVVDMFHRARPKATIVAVTITSGNRATIDGGEWKVPKKELIGVLQALLSTRRFHIVPSLPLATLLSKELGTFKVKVNIATGNESFEAWRERDHDDLCLAVGLGCWYGERQQDESCPPAVLAPGMQFPARPWDSGLAGPLPRR